MAIINKIMQGDCRDILPTLKTESVNCCVTSPPYWGLRDYGQDDQIGLEKTPELYVETLIQVFREVKRILKKDGTLWLNLGDSYASNLPTGTKDLDTGWSHGELSKGHMVRAGGAGDGLKPKDLIGIPWRVAFALQADGWYLRSDIIWHKPNPMPESVTDRPTKSHEYIFLLSKSAKYYYDADAIAESANYDGRKDIIMKGSPKYADGFGPSQNPQPIAVRGHVRWKKRKNDGTNYGGDGTGFRDHSGYNNLSKPYVRNKRTVWTVNTQPFPGAHFAVFPPDLIVPCIKAGCPENGIVLDPFIGSGTTANVARRLNRNFIGIDLNPQYIEIAEKRIEETRLPLFEQMDLL